MIFGLLRLLLSRSMSVEQTSAAITGSIHTHQCRADVHRYALFPAMCSAVNLQSDSDSTACPLGWLETRVLICRRNWSEIQFKAKIITPPTQHCLLLLGLPHLSSTEQRSKFILGGFLSVRPLCVNSLVQLFWTLSHYTTMLHSNYLPPIQQRRVLICRNTLNLMVEF